MQWKVVEGTEGKYEVSSCGKVRVTRDDRSGKAVQREIKIVRSGKGEGYPAVWIRLNGWSRLQYVHTLVLTAFAEPRPEGCVCNHKDGNKWNSDISNLEWVTESENNIHALRLGLRVPLRGSAHQNYGKSTEEMFGRRFLGAGNPFYGKSHSDETKQLIRAKSSGERSWRAQVTNNDATEIRRRFLAGDSKATLAKEYDVSWWVIHGIVHWKTYRFST